MKRLLILFSCVLFSCALLSGCITPSNSNGYEEFFEPNTKLLDPRNEDIFPHFVFLKEGEEPAVIQSNNIEKDFYSFISKGFIAIGKSAFEGALQEFSNSAEQARRIRATHVLLQATHINTVTRNSAIAIPNIQTTSHSGSVSGYGYSGTSISTGTNYIPYSYTIERYNQTAYCFVKSTQKFRIGLWYRDMTEEENQKYEKNTGAVIFLIGEDSPAFIANMLKGDLVIEINGIPVKNAAHADEITAEIPQNSPKETYKVLRKGKILTFVLKPTR